MANSFKFIEGKKLTKENILDHIIELGEYLDELNDRLKKEKDGWVLVPKWWLEELKKQGENK